MTAKKPLCAFCGRPLGKAYVLHSLLNADGWRGRCAVAWHWDCLDKEADNAMPRYADENGRMQNPEWPRILDLIDSRGPGRVRGTRGEPTSRRKRVQVQATKRPMEPRP